MTRITVTLATAVALRLAAAGDLKAQVGPIVQGDGWEAFPGVWYEGGDSRFPRRMIGALVLTDSTIAFHLCSGGSTCNFTPAGRPLFADTAVFSVNLVDLRELSTSSRTHTPGVGRRILWGTLANNREQELVAIAFDTETTAEAPVFRTRPTQSGAIDAKIRFRLRRLGIELPSAP